MQPTKDIIAQMPDVGEEKTHVRKTKKKLSGRKAASIQFADFCRRNKVYKEERLQRLYNSGDYLELVTDTEEQHSKVFSAFLSGIRWDPMQAHSTATKKALRLAVAVEYIQLTYKCPILFLTLTVPNCKGSELAATHKLLSRARLRLLHDFRPLRKVVRGYVSSEEVTYNAASDTYHPHLHILLAVSPDYFSSGKPAITQSQLVEWWKKATDAAEDETRIVDIRAMRSAGPEDVAELTKYVTKTAELIEHGDEVMSTVMRAYYGQKQSACSGVFMEAFRKYEAGELYEIVAMTQEQGIEWAYIRAGNWGGQSYAWSERRELSEVEAEHVSAAAQYEAGELSAEEPEPDKVIEPEPEDVADVEAWNRKKFLPACRKYHAKAWSLAFCARFTGMETRAFMRAYSGWLAELRNADQRKLQSVPASDQGEDESRAPEQLELFG